jgi:hypothetical protein
MNKSTFATVATAAALAFGGIALAQSPAGTPSSSDVPPKTSTPGAGCTATGNALSGGNLGGPGTSKDCRGTTTMGAPAAAAAPATVATPAPAPAASPAPDTSAQSAAAAPAPSTSTTTAASSTPPPPQRVARADRG